MKAVSYQPFPRIATRIAPHGDAYYDVTMAKQTVAIRIDASTRLRIRRAASRRQTTPSGILRTAVTDWLDREERAAVATPYELMADLIGSVKGGDAKRSTRSAREIAAMLRAHGRRRSGR
jgi:hypothetical protein